MKVNSRYFLTPAHYNLAKARYFLKDSNGELLETDIAEVFQREVSHIYQKDNKEHQNEALKLRLAKKIVPAGRPLAQSGTGIKNLLNCFVIGFKDDTREAISELKRKHFNIQSQGGGTGINFSKLRPRGSICKRSQSRSSGAVGFITDFSYQSSNIQQGGNRSGANLGVLEDWHPDLLDFILHKTLHNWENIRKFAYIFDEDGFQFFQWNNPHQWQMFNVSVVLSDAFMEQVIDDSDQPWKLHWKSEEWNLWRFKHNEKEFIVTAPNEEMAWYKAGCNIPFFNTQNLELIEGPFDWPAKKWFSLLCKNAWEDGCPGVFFGDLAKRYHNGEYCSPIEAANPCGEQLLPKNGVCCLTSLCLPSFLKGSRFQWKEFKKSIHEAVRGLDNILTLNTTGESDIDKHARSERRIGLGTIGLAELLIRLKLRYSSKEGRDFTAKVLRFMRDEAYRASIELARERGPFVWFDYEGYSKSEFFKTLPKDIQKDIKKHGIRNVTLLTQAPTGTTGTMTGYSQGCEPYFAMCFQRNSRVGPFLDGSPAFRKWLKKNNIDYSKYNFSLSELRKKYTVPDYFEEAHEISWRSHLEMQAVFSKYLDSSCSKTINIPNNFSVEDVESIYVEAYKLGIKNTTIYRDGSKQQILEHLSPNSKKKVRPKVVVPTASPKRPPVLDCDIHHTSVKGEKWTVLVGLFHGAPYEIFCAPQESFELSSKYNQGKLIKNGGGQYHLDLGEVKLKNISSLLKTDEHKVLTRLLSTSLRHGVPIEYLSDQLAKAEGSVVDFSKAVLRILKKYAKEDQANALKTCPKCGGTNLVVVSGCPQCLDCNYSKCE